MNHKRNQWLLILTFWPLYLIAGCAQDSFTNLPGSNTEISSDDSTPYLGRESEPKPRIQDEKQREIDSNSYLGRESEPASPIRDEERETDDTASALEPSREEKDDEENVGGLGYEGAEEDIDDTEEEIDDTEEEEDGEEEDECLGYEGAEEDIDDTEEDIDDTEEDIDDTEEDIDDTEEDIDDTEEDIDDTEEEIDDIEEEETISKEDCEEWAPGVSAVKVTMDAGSIQSAHHEPYQGGTALRIIGIYEGKFTGLGIQECTVNLDLDHDVVLVLDAYESVEWTVTNTGSGAIEKIIVHGSGPAQINTDSNIPVKILEGDEGGWPYSSGYHFDDEDTHDLVAAAETMTGLKLTSFHGAYTGTSFQFNEGCSGPVESIWPECPANAKSPANKGQGLLDEMCPEITSESQYCLAFNFNGDLKAIGLDSGNVCTVTSSGIENTFEMHSIAWIGSSIYTTGNYGKITQIDLADGTVESAFAWSGGLAAWNGGLFSLPYHENYSDSMSFYPSFSDAQCQSPSDFSADIWESRITSSGDTLFSAWHSTDHLAVYELPSMNQIDTIALENYDTWVNGMSIIDGTTLVLNATFPEQRFAVFDMEGNAIKDIPVDEMLHGLACRSGN